MNGKNIRVWAIVSLIVAGGCHSPLDRSAEQQLRESLIRSHRQQLEAAGGTERTMTLSREPSDVEVELSDERRAEIDQMSGLAAYENAPLELGADLVGRDDAEAVVRVSLERVVQLTVQHNLDLQVARLRPAIAQTQIDQAEAVFDVIFFTDADWSKLDTPRPTGAIPGISGNTQEETFTLRSGLRKRLFSGGTLEASTTITRNERVPSVIGVPSFYDSDVLVSLTQPVLRNFGSQVNRSQIVLTQNAKLSEAQGLRQTLLDRVAEAESEYWNLVFARQQLLIRKRLYERTVEDRDRLKKRADFDVTPVQLTEANSFVELRRSDVIRSRQSVRDASDRLKRLMNDPQLSIASETLLVPVQMPTEQAIRFNLLDAVTTALRHRPQMQQALLAIEDASVRKRVADNLRLPVLDISLGVGLNSVGTTHNDAYNKLGDVDYIDYLLSARFEMPIGNRGPKAFSRQRRLERQASVLEYQRLAQDVVLEVKSALRTVATNYELIGSARAARRAAADSLRAIEQQEEAGIALTPEFLLDLKLSAQRRVADAEIQEIAALRDYNTAIAELYRVMGTLLQRNGIEME